MEKRLRDAGLPVMSIAELHDKAIALTGEPEPLEFADRTVAVVRYRDGSVIDVIRQVKTDGDCAGRAAHCQGGSCRPAGCDSARFGKPLLSISMVMPGPVKDG